MAQYMLCYHSFHVFRQCFHHKTSVCFIEIDLTMVIRSHLCFYMVTMISMHNRVLNSLSHNFFCHSVFILRLCYCSPYCNLFGFPHSSLCILVFVCKWLCVLCTFLKAKDDGIHSHCISNNLIYLTEVRLLQSHLTWST